MAKKSYKAPSISYIAVSVFIGLFLLAAGFYLGVRSVNTSNSVLGTSSSGSASAVASAAYTKCVNSGGFVSTSKRGTWGYYQMCNFTDDMSCDLYALYDGNCPVGGVKTIGYSTTDQVFCALRGGTPQGSNNGQCKMPNGKTCSTASVYKGTCQYDN
ncbi:MAG: hypothetical protein KA035_04510 [Candidatus Levybacteria bacterium]|nr:hypothetical protein [Candidatus Levybacteria bacterium]